MKRLASTLFVLAAALALASSALAAPPIPTSLSISVSPAAISVTESATVTATLTPDTGTVNCGMGQIQFRVYDITVNPPAPLTDWLQLANQLPVVANQFSAVFDPTDPNLQATLAGLGVTLSVGQKVSFRAGYVSSGQDCDFSTTGPGQSPTADLVFVGASCPNGQTTGVFVSIVGPDGVGNPPPGYYGSWRFTVRVQACEDVTNVTAQGGANGWTENPKTIFMATQGTTTAYVKNRNTVYLWTIGNMLQGATADLVVQVTGGIKNSPGECGKVKLLNGDWSAMYTDGLGVRSKSAYTTYTSTITVTCP